VHTKPHFESKHEPARPRSGSGTNQCRTGPRRPALVNWAVGLGQPTIVTTNFRPFEAVILHRSRRPTPTCPWSGWTTATTPKPPISSPMR
jgi:hypothetical protein